MKRQSQVSFYVASFYWERVVEYLWKLTSDINLFCSDLRRHLWNQYTRRLRDQPKRGRLGNHSVSCCVDQPDHSGLCELSYRIRCTKRVQKVTHLLKMKITLQYLIYVWTLFYGSDKRVSGSELFLFMLFMPSLWKVFRSWKIYQ